MLQVTTEITFSYKGQEEQSVERQYDSIDLNTIDLQRDLSYLIAFQEDMNIEDIKLSDIDIISVYSDEPEYIDEN